MARLQVLAFLVGINPLVWCVAQQPAPFNPTKPSASLTDQTPEASAPPNTLRSNPPTSSAVAPTEEQILLPEVRTELLRREKLDQEVRQKLIQWLKETGFTQIPKPVTDAKLLKELGELSAQLAAVDEENLKYLKEMVTKHTWLSRSLVGQDGAKAAWLILQHSDKDREFQKQCLKVMEGLPENEVDKKDIAYLTDRVLVGEGKEQYFGTQIRTNEQGELEVAPLFEPENVDERRKRVGLPPLQEYLEMVRGQVAGK